MTTSWNQTTYPSSNIHTPRQKSGQITPIDLKIPACGGPSTGATQTSKYYAFDIVDTSYFINMAYTGVDLKIFFDSVQKHSFSVASTTSSSFGMRIIPDIQKPGYGWVGTRKLSAAGNYYLTLDFNNSNYENWQYLKIPDVVRFQYIGGVADYGGGSGGTINRYYGFIADTGFNPANACAGVLPTCPPPVIPSQI
jgi:hypothetical protein